MPTDVRSSRWSQTVAWMVASLFLLGFFLSSVGAWTGPILGVWFVGTQNPRRGFFWLMVFAFVPSLIFSWRGFPLTGPQRALQYLAVLLLASLLSVLPLVFHRLVNPRLPGFITTLPFPLAAMAIPSLALALHLGAAPAIGLDRFFIFWFAAMIVWMWNHESRATGLVFAAGCVCAAGCEIFRVSGSALPQTLPGGILFGWSCLGAVLLLSVWALLHPVQHPTWANRPDAVALLQSPFSSSPLHVVSEGRQEALVSSTGERFPIRDGIPAFLKPEDLTGDNGKYNHLYETIGGFYDDTQRVVAAIRGLDIDSYFLAYMSLIEAKPGDRVLETSVGTGLNFKYLSRGVKLSGLDLSPEMLVNCQANLRRWQMEADLYLGNAESLPFADSSFDIVFHAGGINFFSDRAKAIREMIRVAKPGSFLLITDETEEYAKKVYENMPIASGYYRNRSEAVTTPIDLVPPEMQQVHLEMIKGGQFYVITFRKPASA